VVLLAAIGRGAGKNLTTSSFEKAGYALRNVSIPGTGGPVSFGAGRPYAALGPVYMVSSDVGTKNLVVAGRSATG
jgi:hypothetical protein